MNKHIPSGALILLVLMQAACSGPGATPGPALTLAPAPTATAAGLFEAHVDIGGRGLHMWCYGAGSPTLIYESWLGARGEMALPLIIRAGGNMRTCVYDRANVPGGLSDPAPAARTSLDIASDLRAALRVTRIEPPYALVGDSFGAMNAVVFAGQYPGEVTALAVIGPLAPGVLETMLRALPKPAADEPSDIAHARRRCTGLLTDNSEGIDVPASEDQVRWATLRANLPVLIVTASSPLSDWLALDPRETAVLEGAWRSEQRFYQSLSANTRAIRVVAGHDVLGDDPESVAAAFLTLVAEAGNQLAEAR